MRTRWLTGALLGLVLIVLIVVLWRREPAKAQRVARTGSTDNAPREPDQHRTSERVEPPSTAELAPAKVCTLRLDIRDEGGTPVTDVYGHIFGIVAGSRKLVKEAHDLSRSSLLELLPGKYRIVLVPEDLDLGVGYVDVSIGEGKVLQSAKAVLPSAGKTMLEIENPDGTKIDGALAHIKIALPAEGLEPEFQDDSFAIADDWRSVCSNVLRAKRDASRGAFDRSAVQELEGMLSAPMLAEISPFEVVFVSFSIRGNAHLGHLPPGNAEVVVSHFYDNLNGFNTQTYRLTVASGMSPFKLLADYRNVEIKRED